MDAESSSPWWPDEHEHSPQQHCKAESHRPCIAAAGLPAVNAALILGEVDGGALGHRSWLVQDDASPFEPRSRGSCRHLRLRRLTGKRSDRLAQVVDLVEPAGDLVPTAGRWGRHTLWTENPREKST